jgi:hypothetical protein
MKTTERGEILEHLQKSRADLLHLVSDVSDADFMKKPSKEVWSIAEVVEHLVLIDESLFNSILHKAENVPDTTPETVPNDKILYVVPNPKYGKVTAPKNLVPQSTYNSKDEALMAFNTNRDRIENFVKTTDLPLQRVAFRHFALGLLNGMNWLVFIAAHCQRHINQIRNLKKGL